MLSKYTINCFFFGLQYQLLIFLLLEVSISESSVIHSPNIPLKTADLLVNLFTSDTLFFTGSKRGTHLKITCISFHKQSPCESS